MEDSRVAPGSPDAFSDKFDASLLDAAPDAIVISDERGVILFSNDLTARMFGWQPEELLGRSVEALMPESFRKRHEAHRQTFMDKPSARPMGLGMELVAERSDGTPFPVEVSLKPLEVGGRRVVAAAIRDITERKRASDELRNRANQQATIARLGLEAMRATDTAEFMSNVCELLRTTLGVDYAKVLKHLPEEGSLELIAGSGWKSGYVGSTRVREGVGSPAGFTLSTGQSIVTKDARREERFMIPRFLAEHGVTSSMTALVHGREEVYGVIAVDSVTRRDFSREDLAFLQSAANILGQAIERSRSEETVSELNTRLESLLRERTQELEGVRQELDSVLHSLAHDLRTPLRGIHGYAQVLQEEAGEALTEECRRYLGRVQEAAGTLGHLMSGLLELASVGRSHPKIEPVHLSQLANEMLDELRRSESEREVSVTVQPGLAVLADASLLRLVLGNLLENAWKYTRPRSDGMIEVGCIQDGQERVYYVRDNGVGFDMEYVHKLFTPFGRVRSRDELDGRGIGLAMTQRALQKQGGRAWAHGKSCDGATFYFSLPEAEIA